MRESGSNIGGESSGHFILGDYSPSGDGLIAAMKLLEIVQERGQSLAELRRCITLYPIRKCNLRIAERIPLDELPSLRWEIEELERLTGERGRLLVRYSGTEPVIRLLVEGEDAAWTESCMRRLREAVAENLKVQ
jgi:phosphoglucosamine mutase